MESPIIYIKKLNHPIKEIRERSLKLLLTKLQCGWELPDEIDCIRELLDNLWSWLNEKQLLLQKEALHLLLITLKTKCGAYVVKDQGVRKILTKLNGLKSKIEHTDACDVLDDVIETLRFVNTVDSETSVRIPRLQLNTSSSSKTSQNVSSYNDFNFERLEKSYATVGNHGDTNMNEKTHISESGIKCLLFPWVDLGTSDIKTMNLIMDSLKVSKSTRRCCRFIRDVFVRDFPVQIFLNRPTIIKTLLAIVNGQFSGNTQEALCTLLCITRSLHVQFQQLFSLDFVCQPQKVLEKKEELEDNINIELQNAMDYRQDTPQHDALLVLRQLPVPIFALDSLQTIFTVMARSVIDGSTNDGFDLKQTNTCLSLADSLIKLLLDCVSKKFWRMEHKTQTHRDMAHKTCIIMRMLGDLLTKYNKAFENDPEGVHYRVVWVRLVQCGGQLLHWAEDSPLPPAALVTALQMAQIDPVLDLLYPKISNDINNVLNVAKSAVDKEHKSKYSELTKLYTSIECAVKFKTLKSSPRNCEELLSSVQKTLPIFHFNLDKKYFKRVVSILFEQAKKLDVNDKNWSLMCEIVLKLMAHSVDWIRVTLYMMLTEFVRNAFVGDESKQTENEKCLKLLCHVEILTEICCQGLSSNIEEVEASASEIILLILRGRLVLSEGCWWQLLASVQPVLPLLHVYAAHDTVLGKAICKSLEAEICMCMGVSRSERRRGLARTLYVHCGAVRVDAARELCHLLDDKKYLPPSESIRADVLLNAMKRVEPQDFNLEDSVSPSHGSQTTGLTQILEVLKQDLSVEADGLTYTAREGLSKATLEPALRRSTLQQLTVMMRNKEMHDVFMKDNGLNLIVSLLRMSLMVDDFLTYPECAISCVSILNSIGFENRHALASIQDLPLLLLRVILVFPANDSCVLLCTQVMALCVWAGFLLHEIDASGRRVPAAPLSVVRRVRLPFPALSYWNTSPNTEHSRISWLLSDEPWRNAVMFRWWWANGGAAIVRAGGLVTGASGNSGSLSPEPSLTATASCLTAICTQSLLALENATSHQQVIQALLVLQCYLPLAGVSRAPRELCGLPWRHTARYLRAPPASPADVRLLDTLLHCVIAYVTYVPAEDNSMSWVKESFIGNDASIIALLSRDQMYPHSTQEDLELTQLRILIVRVVVRCLQLVEQDGDYCCKKMESLIKILLASLEMVDLKNFHMLGYLNELLRCIRYAVYSRYCVLSEDTLIHCLRAMTRTLGGCASGSGRKGHACRLDATLATLALVTHAHKQNIPVQRWSECFCSSTMRVLVADCAASRTELRAAALRAVAALAAHAQLLPHLVQCVPCGSLMEFAVGAFDRSGEANAVRAAAAALITMVTARSSHAQISENDVMKTVIETSFMEECLSILIDFCNKEDYNEFIEPNVPLSVLERESELDVRAEKCDVAVCPSPRYRKPPPTAPLVAAVADVINNLCTYKNADVRRWNEQGLYRILFRCACWTSEVPGESSGVRAAACRALVAAATHRCVRVALANTVDCLHEFMANLVCSQIDQEKCDIVGAAQAQSYLLLAALLQEESAKEIIWKELEREKSAPFFHLLLESLENANTELREGALYCLTVLTGSMVNQPLEDATKDQFTIEYFDNLKSAYLHTDRLSAGDGQDFEDCQPEYVAESYCKVLVKLFHEYSDSDPCYCSHDERWRRVCACLASLLRASIRARAYGAHRRLPRALSLALQRIRDALSLQGKSAEVIRNSNSDPILETLHWLLTLMSCLMLESPAVKESLCDEHIEISLVRLWPWCMMTETLRTDLLLLLFNFTNNCPKAWSRLCVCVSGRSVLGELCTLAVRETARVRAPTLLPPLYRVLTNCAPNHHCRAVMIKSELVSSAVRSCVRSGAAAALCAALAQYGDGACAVAGALPPTPPRRLLPALAHAAHHARQLCLQSQDILELFSSALLAGDTSEVVTAARAVWALAANNHRAKLILRTNGLASAVESGLQRLMKLADDSAERAVQLLQYTHTVLQTS